MICKPTAGGKGPVTQTTPLATASGWHLEVVEQLAGVALAVAVHDLQELARELHGCRLKAHPVAARRIAEHEAVVDVDKVAAAVHHDVAVVAVLYLQAGSQVQTEQ